MARTRRRVKQYRNIKPLNKRTKRIKKQRRRSQRQRRQRQRSSKKLRGGESVDIEKLEKEKKYYLPANRYSDKTPLTFLKKVISYPGSPGSFYNVYFKNDTNNEEIIYLFNRDDDANELYEEVPETESSWVVDNLSLDAPVTENLQQLKKVNVRYLEIGKKYYLPDKYYNPNRYYIYVGPKEKPLTLLQLSELSPPDNDEHENSTTYRVKFKDGNGNIIHIYIDYTDTEDELTEVPDNDSPQVFPENIDIGLTKKSSYTYKKGETDPVYVGEFSKFDNQTGTYEFTCKKQNLSIKPNYGDNVSFQMVKKPLLGIFEKCASQEDVK
jgi:hypothetical protein